MCTVLYSKLGLVSSWLNGCILLAVRMWYFINTLYYIQMTAHVPYLLPISAYSVFYITYIIFILDSLLYMAIATYFLIPL